MQICKKQKIHPLLKSKDQKQLKKELKIYFHFLNYKSIINIIKNIWSVTDDICDEA